MKKKRRLKKQINKTNWTEINNEYCYEIEEEEINRIMGFEGK
jgi:hypothetical protein